jgi:succinate-semialdehyde dehydrogenase / glutarate-semialdehyde dehydrogenase
MATLRSINPSNYEVLGNVQFSWPDTITDSIERARHIQPEWWALGIEGRVAALRTAFADLGQKREELSLLQAREVGMPLTQVREDFDSTMELADWYFDHAAELLAPVITHDTEREMHRVVREPVGVAAVIVPWNFPLSNIVWGCLQSLIAGNAVVLKHSEECPLTGEFVEQVFVKHLPDGVFSEIYGDGSAGELLATSVVDMIAFTGSTRTGRKLYEIAARKFIPVTLELGGSAPGIIWNDADVAAAVDSVCALRLANAGQCCDGLKRLLVHESIYDDVLAGVVETMRAQNIGPADDPATELGPLAAKRQHDLLMGQLESSVATGATIVTGGNSLENKLGGAFVEPTVLVDVEPLARVWNEEIFGPVLPVVKFETEQQAIALANDTHYGLGAYVFTADTERAQRLAAGIKSGMVSVNGVNYIRPFNPFGGYKGSGVGREHGRWGFDDVTQPKVIATPK